MAGRLVAEDKVTQAAIGARVVRADGSVEDLGMVAYYHRNPLRRAWFRLQKAAGRRVEVF